MANSLYAQGQSPLYDIDQTNIPMNSGELTVKYVEMAEEGHMEFPHSHTDHEIYYCVSGRMKIKLDGMVHHLSAGQFALLAPGVLHDIRYDPVEPKKYFIFVFHIAPGKQAGPDSEHIFFNAFEELFAHNSVFVGVDRHQVDEVIERIYRERGRGDYGCKELLRNYYLELIILTLRNLIPEDGRQGFDSTNINLAMQITKYLHENYSKSINLQEVADALYVTPRHINRVYHEYFGSSFKKTLQNFRVNYAKNYLCDTDYSIEKVAELVGFSSTYTFTQLFKKLEGISATEYRARHAKP